MLFFSFIKMQLSIFKEYFYIIGSFVILILLAITFFLRNSPILLYYCKNILRNLQRYMIYQTLIIQIAILLVMAQKKGIHLIFVNIGIFIVKSAQDKSLAFYSSILSREILNYLMISRQYSLFLRFNDCCNR
ncbi:unnamed protein product [Paramecium sonneborni]|uniref:Uncharacterized protein n=1 Tax=Paramecium sonneborni TaxID=65129 RepID=A0A8S1RPU7_9CILI|nr:unnamed protein product [Paramecium sonneborni]